MHVILVKTSNIAIAGFRNEELKKAFTRSHDQYSLIAALFVSSVDNHRPEFN